MTGASQHITDDIEGIGGRIKERPEDFIVDEAPLYEPCGEGEHVYLLVEKRGMTTLDAVRVIERHFGCHRRAIGYAGLKDKHAVTRQHFSVHLPGRRIEEFGAIEHERMRVLWTDRHTNKLRRGHLAGNRFVIRVRGVEPTAAVRAWRVLAVLSRRGVPNRFGRQRFGIRGNNHRIGLALVHGDAGAVIREMLGESRDAPGVLREAYSLAASGKYDEALRAFPRSARAERAMVDALRRGADPEQAVRAVEFAEQAFFVSALQSAIFNQVLDARIADATFDRCEPGDVAMKHDNRATFRVDGATAADPETISRLERLEISPTGPMWGPRMERAEGRAGALEREALAAFGVRDEHLPRFAELGGEAAAGERRPLRVPIIDPDVEGGMDEHGPFVRVAFELPRGAFATTVMDEIMKTDMPANDDID